MDAQRLIDRALDLGEVVGVDGADHGLEGHRTFPALQAEDAEVLVGLLGESRPVVLSISRLPPTKLARLSADSRTAWRVSQETEVITPGTAYYLPEAKAAKVEGRLQHGTSTPFGQWLMSLDARNSAELRAMLADKAFLPVKGAL